MTFRKAVSSLARKARFDCLLVKLSSLYKVEEQPGRPLTLAVSLLGNSVPLRSPC